MTKNQAERLAKLQRARRIISTSDPRDVALVESVYNSMVHRFVNPDFVEQFTDQQYAAEWNKCRDQVSFALTDNNLIAGYQFFNLWSAFDTLSTEQAETFA